MFTAALFTTAKIWEQPKCPSVNEWIKKMWYIYTMEYYSAIKNEILPFMMARGHYATWNKSDRERQMLYNHTYLWNLEKPDNKNQAHDAQNRLLIVKGRRSVGRLGEGVNKYKHPIIK